MLICVYKVYFILFGFLTSLGSLPHWQTTIGNISTATDTVPKSLRTSGPDLWCDAYVCLNRISVCMSPFLLFFFFRDVFADLLWSEDDCRNFPGAFRKERIVCCWPTCYQTPQSLPCYVRMINQRQRQRGSPAKLWRDTICPLEFTNT